MIGGLDADPARGLVVGVDVGGTKAAALVVDGDGRRLARVARSMGDRAGADGIEPIEAAIRAAIESADSVERLVAIGVGVPGRVDAETGYVRLATNLEWRDLPLGERLSTIFGVPCAVENDVRLAAAGLVGKEVSDGARSLAYVGVGTGIGAGLVLDGRLYRGPRGTAGEIGHMIVEPGGEVCSCGQQGCLETVASGPAIARRGELAAERNTAGRLAALRPLSAKDVYDAARDGDLDALAITTYAGAVLARQIGGLVMTCDLERVLLGGGVASAGAVFIAPVVAELDRLRSRSPLLSELLPPGAVELLASDFDAVAWGGVALARRIPAPDRARHAATRAPETAPEPRQMEEVIPRDALT
jgi:glucokinase